MVARISLSICIGGMIHSPNVTTVQEISQLFILHVSPLSILKPPPSMVIEILSSGIVEVSWLLGIVSSFQSLVVKLWGLAGCCGCSFVHPNISGMAVAPSTSLFLEHFWVLACPLPRLLLRSDPQIPSILGPTAHSPLSPNSKGIYFSNLETSPGPLPSFAHKVFLLPLQISQFPYWLKLLKIKPEFFFTAWLFFMLCHIPLLK